MQLLRYQQILMTAQTNSKSVIMIEVIKGIIKRDKLDAETKLKSTVDVRQYLSFIMRHQYGMTLTEIAAEFNQTHTSIMHGISMHISRTLKGDPYIEENIIEYKKELGDGDLFSIDYTNLQTFLRGRRPSPEENQPWEVEDSSGISQGCVD